MATKTLNLTILCCFVIFGMVTSHDTCHDDCNETCPEGKSINTTCNTCRCLEKGWACTLMACPEKECDPNKYRSDCRNCICRNGTWECEGCPGTCGKECPVCKPIKIGCNTCNCVRGGWGCTKIGCSYKECDPDEYRADCSECECVDGKWKCRCCGKSPPEKEAPVGR